MEEKKYIQLEEVIDICQKFINGEISHQELQEWGNTVQIRFYMPMAEKTLCLDKILDDMTYSNDKHLKIGQLEMNKFWYILLEYTNIDITEKEDLLTLDNYDLIYPVIGFWLKDLVCKDYDIVIDMLNQSINYSNVLDIISTAEEISENNDYKKLIKIDKEILDIFKDKEKLSAISDIVKYGATKETQDIVDILQTEALKAVEKKETK